MIEKIIRFWKYFWYFFHSKKIWSQPRPSKVLIYDAANSEILLEYLKPWNPEILHVRKEQINILILLKSFFRKGRRVEAYKDCFIEKVRPRLIITTIDNNTIFYKISGRHPDLKTLFIQNGLRTYYGCSFEELDHFHSDILSALFVDYMLVFGSAVGDRFSKYIEGNIVQTGSLKNNFMGEEMPTQAGTIAIISEWRSGEGQFLAGTFFSFEDFYMRPDKLVIQCIVDYAKEKNKQLVIIPAMRNSSDLIIQEKAYFRELMGREPKFLRPPGPYPGYLAVDSVEILVALESTLVYESIARGKKAAIFPIRGAMIGVAGRNFGWPADYPDEGPFWTNKPDSDIFIRILDYLFEVSDEQWKKDVESTNFSSIMEYDAGNTIFQSILEKELGPPPTSAH